MTSFAASSEFGSPDGYRTHPEARNQLAVVSALAAWSVPLLLHPETPMTSVPPKRVSSLLLYGAVGNGRGILAPVHPTSAIGRWLCLPRFDSPSIFARILDREKGGTFRVLSGDREIEGKLAYLPNTNVLSTRFEDGDNAWEVVDFAPRIPEGLGVRVPLELVRVIRPLQGHLAAPHRRLRSAPRLRASEARAPRKH